MECQGGSRTYGVCAGVGVSECGEVGFSGTAHTINGIGVNVRNPAVFVRAWGSGGIFGPAILFGMPVLATTRIGAFQMTPILTLGQSLVVVTSSTIGLAVCARALP